MTSPFFLRLALLGSRISWGRPVGLVLGIAFGVALFLLMLGAFQALDRRAERGAWILADGTPADGAIVLDADHVASVRSETYFGDAVIARLEIAATADTRVVAPGIAALPAPGTYFASPALAALIDAQPRDRLGARFGTRAGLIGDEALVGPDAMVAVVGRTAAEIGGAPGTRILTAFAGQPFGESVAYQTVLAVGAIGLFFPVVLFVSIVTRLGAAERRERFVTLRLLGAAPRQVALIAGLETLVLATLGGMVGVGLAFILRPVAALIPLNGGAFFPADLAVGPLATLASVAGMVVVAVFASLLSIRRAGVTPLGVTRQMNERRPRLWRMVPLVLGLVCLAAPQAGFESQAPLFVVAGFGLVTIGIVLVGPWLTFQASRILARRARTAAGVIAGSRIRSAPAATFRSVSGLVIAVFMVSVFTGGSSGVVEMASVEDMPGLIPTDALIAPIPAGTDIPALVATLTADPGTTAVVVGFREPGVRGDGIVLAAAALSVLGLPAVDAPFGRVARFAYLLGDEPAPVEPVTADGATLVPSTLIVRTDGSLVAIERARTAIETATIAGTVPIRRVEAVQLGILRIMNELAFVAYVGAFVSIAIAGCSLAIATASAMIDRRRVLGLMRLMGMPVAQLRRIVGFEAAVPLLAVLFLSVSAGLGVAWLILRNLASIIPFELPGLTYFVILALGASLALGAVAATFGMIRRNTAISATRFE